ncbi:ATP-binding cassette sub-family A member 1, partial [Trichostrongylus colubriformis]
MESFNYVSKISSQPVFLLPLMAFESVPMLCNETIFNSSFRLLPNHRGYGPQFISVSVHNCSYFEEGFRNANVSLLELTQSLATFSSLMQQQPLYGGLSRWNHLFSGSLANMTSNLTAALFCGENPFDTSSDAFGPAPTNAKTPFDELRQNLIEFMEKIVPGHQKHDKQFCHDVWVHDDLNCSSLESAMMQRVRPLFTGYILVTPPSPAVNKLIDILNNPLRMVDFMRQELYKYPEIANSLQNALYGSDLRPASMNILVFLQRFGKQLPVNPQWLQTVEFVLEHLFAPATDPYSFGALTKNFTETFNQYTTCFLLDRFVTVANESVMEETATCLADYQQYFSGIVIMNMTDDATEFDPLTIYKIRHLPNLVDNTYYYEDSPRRVFDRRMPFTDLKYVTYGFSFLQEAIDRAIIGLRVKSNQSLGMYAQQEPYPCVAFDKFNIVVFLGLFVILSFICPAALLVKNIVYEKELRLKEQMRIMGLGDMVHLWSWAIISLVINLTSTAIIAAIIKFGNLLTAVDFTLIFVFLSLFAIASIASCLLLSTFFTNANISTAATCLLYFLFFYPYQLSIKARNKTFTQFTLIFPQTTLGYGAAMLAIYSDEGKGTWKDINSIYLEAYDVSLVECMVAFVVQTVLFIILAWYKSAVSPGIYGVSLPWYFFLTKRYWFPDSVENIEYNHSADSAQPASDSFDSEPKDLSLTVYIDRMSKIYSNGTKALDNLTLRLYEDQITALLGHNGAGKTTTMSILCGLYSPSSGTATVYGMDIRKEIQRVRDVLGVCPQYNVLFSHLTVSEQLKLFAALKGTPDDRIQHDVDDILQSVSLVDKANELASTLSGGMKRRLCIGIALVGGSRFVILDEPTAGVDVTSRKEIWSLLQNNKKGRTILLSTHHMDEADILSDRIALLSEGRLITLGSSMFLKNKYGDAFQLFACKQDHSRDYTAVVTRIITEALIPIKLNDETENELVFSIPISTDSRKLEKFFKFFDEKKDQYLIGEYGISAPTLQEIFVRLSPKKEYVVPRHRAGILSKIKKGLRGGVVESDERQLINTTAASVYTGSSTTASGSGAGLATITTSSSRESPPQDFDEDVVRTPLTGWELTMSHTKAIMKSRSQYTIRSKKHILFEVILPVCLLFSCELYAKIQFSGQTTAMVT